MMKVRSTWIARLAIMSAVGATAAMAVGIAPANAVTGPPQGSEIAAYSCSTANTSANYEFASGTTFDVSATGGYSGNAIVGDTGSAKCAGDFPWTLTISSSATMGNNWSYGGYGLKDLGGLTCQYWAYVPSTKAGAPDARYFAYGVDYAGNTSYLFNKAVDQESNTGWYYLGSHSIPSYDYGTSITLDNSEPSHAGWDGARGQSAAEGERCAAGPESPGSR